MRRTRWSITSRSVPTVRRLSRTFVGLVLLASCKHHEGKPAPPPVPAPVPAPVAAIDAIPRTDTPITLDGELREPAWNNRALRGVLVADDGEQARPYSEVRLLYDPGTLFVGLYAADEDIRTTDTWKLTIGTRTLTIDASGHASAGDVSTGVDRDGTLDQPGDYDEEWVIEAAIPLATLGAPPLAIEIGRCDTPKDGRVRCGRWHARLPLQ
jgi:hypothetical protein